MKNSAKKEEPNQVGEKAEPNLYGQLLAIRDCLIRDDKDEAYHILCTMADPDLSNENHWAAWELKSKLTPIEPLKTAKEMTLQQCKEDMVAFAAYLHDHSWEYDYREEKTHSLLEHFDEWIKTRKP